MLLSYCLRNGRSVDGVVLAVATDRIRLAIPGRRDAVELRCANGIWRDERGARLTLDFLLAEGQADAVICVSAAAH